MTKQSDRVRVTAVLDGVFIRCGACATRGPKGMAAVYQGAEYTCQACKIRNSVPIPVVPV